MVAAGALRQAEKQMDRTSTTVDLSEALARIEALAIEGRVDEALRRFVALNDAHPGHPQLWVMPVGATLRSPPAS